MMSPSVFYWFMSRYDTSSETHSHLSPSLGPVHVTSHHDSKICLTPECIKVSAAILSAADFNVDPCEDFYSYACGGWKKKNPIPDGRTSWSMFEKLWNENQLVMKNALESASRNSSRTNDTSTDAMEKTITYYESCMDEGGVLEELGGKPLLDILSKEEIGGWKILEEDTKPSITDRESFQKKLEFLQQQYQASGFFSWSVGEDDKSSSRHIIVLDQGGLSLPARDYYLNKTDLVSVAVVNALKDMIVQVAKLFIEENGETLSKEREEVLKAQAEGIVEFETKLAEITIPNSERRNEEELYNKMNISQFQELAGFMNWTEFFQNSFSAVNRPIEASEQILVYAPSFMANLTDLIDTYLNDSNLQIHLENYMVMQLAKVLRNSLSKAYRDAGNGLERAMLGKENHLERWRTCITETDSVLGFALGAMFIRSTFNGTSKLLAQEMIDGVKSAFVEKLEELKWMDEDTKAAALRKAEAITDMIGYPDYILNKDALDEKYHKLEVNAGEYFKNNLKFHRYSLEENLDKLDKPVNRTKWSMTPPTVNAYYMPTKNQIVFPAGLLQSPFFSVDNPRSLNFGAMGVVMGHEFSHAFDDQGRKYDEKGVMRNWWNDATLSEFINRTSCMAKQYSSYSEDDTHVKGNQTLGENMADNGGLQASYKAYNQWLKEKNIVEEDPLPGIKLSHKQLFFLSFSQVWCSASTPQAKKLQTLDDPHSPAKFRVIGVLSNSREFADAFKCKSGATMNPQKKCEVW